MPSLLVAGVLLASATILSTVMVLTWSYLTNKERALGITFVIVEIILLIRNISLAMDSL